MRTWVLLLAAATLLAGCNAPQQATDDEAALGTGSGSGAGARDAPPAGACVEVGSWSDAAMYEALAGREGVVERGTDDLLASAPGDPSARITWFGVKHDDGIEIWLASNATNVSAHGAWPEGTPEDEARVEFLAFVRRVTPLDGEADALADAFVKDKRVRIDAPLRIEDVWQSLGPPEVEGQTVRWTDEEGTTWEARWERATRELRLDAGERPLVLRAEMEGRVHAFSSEELEDQDAQPWLAKAFADSGLPPPEFADWISGSGAGTRPAC